MNVAVVTSCVPFVTGGAEFLARTLTAELEAHGIRAQLIQLPFRWDPPEKLGESMLAAALVEIDLADRVIALKFPAYFVQHETKVLWLLHQFRQVYDLWGTDLQGVPRDATGDAIRASITKADNRCFASCRAVYTISEVVRDRVRHFNGLDPGVLYPPPVVAPIEPTGYGDYVVVGGRVNVGKRQQLAVEAMRYTTSRVKLIVAGPPDVSEDGDRLRRLVATYGLEDRVDLRMSFVSEEEKRELLAGALATAALPYDEDFGYVALEALQARKAVVTTRDAGGIRLFIDDENGIVTDPDPRALACAFDRLYAEKRVARSLGEAGFERLRSLDLSWTRVVETLVS